MTPFDLLWVFFMLSAVQPLISQRLLAIQRAQALRALEKAQRLSRHHLDPPPRGLRLPGHPL